MTGVLAGAAVLGAMGWFGPLSGGPEGGGTIAAASSLPPAVRVPDSGCPPVDTAALSSVPIGSQIGQRAPDFTLPDLTGRPVALSSFRGCPVVLDFWATWCKPCLISVPKLDALAQRHAAQGLKVVAVSLDYRREDAARFLEANAIHGFINLWAPFTEARAVAYLFGVESIPRTVLLDRHGVIRFIGHPQDLTDEIIARWL